MFQKLRKYFINKPNILKQILIIFLSLYFSFAICWITNGSISWFSIILVFFIAFILLNLIFPKILNVKLKSVKVPFNKKELLLYGIIILIFFSFALCASFPALIDPDTTTVWEEVHSGNYNNWHPLIYTLIFIKFPTLLYDSYLSCAIFQLCFIGIILLYFCRFLRKYFLDKKGTILVLLLILLNPMILRASVYLVKDIPFTWCLFLGTLLLIEIVISKGKWIDKNSHKILLILTSLGIMLFRHNGIANVFLMFLVLIILFKEKRKFYIITVVSLILFRLLLYGPIYHNLKVDFMGGKDEMIGVPFNQIAYIYHQNIPITKVEQKLLDQLAPKEKWEEKYNNISVDYLKFDSDVYPIYSYWVNNNFEAIMKFYIKYGIKYPDKYLISYMNITSPWWQINSEHNLYSNPPKTSNSFILSHCSDFLAQYSNVLSQSPLKYIFFSVEVGLYIIVFSLFVVIYKKRKQWTSYLPFVLVLSNTLVMMIFVTAANFRFVYSQLICVFPLLIYALSLKNKSK